MPKVSRQDVQKLIGKHVYAMKKDGTVVSGKLVRVHSNKLYVQPRAKGKKVYTKAILPLVLFDLLAVGTAPYAYGGGFGGGFGGNPYGYGGYPGNYGYSPYGGFW
ncbi:50S ribosomal protein L35ae [Paenibacillus pinihumi]|uniref:50S ribosomal protein L35ae n=1 Tax=Paenibacillus pinihumi TaxID=669462 RepID=UPI0004160B31|nr:50S ribosomal protein L35ae [Paenibacillus pinihumi]